MLTQNIDPAFLATLPKLASYEGDNPKLKALVGLFIPIEDVEKVVPVGERENVWVTDPDGTKWNPWKGVAINGDDDALGYQHAPPVPTFGPRAMSTADLAALGYSDSTLDEIAERLLGERWNPDRLGKSDLRRAMFDRVMVAAHG